MKISSTSKRLLFGPVFYLGTLPSCTSGLLQRQRSSRQAAMMVTFKSEAEQGRSSMRMVRSDALAKHHKRKWRDWHRKKRWGAKPFWKQFMYYTISRAFLDIPCIIVSYSFPQTLSAQKEKNPPTPPNSPTTKKTPHNANSQAWPRLCNCLFLFPQVIYRSTECIYHPIVHYIVVTERSCKNCSVPNWKEDISELASQMFQALELWHKLRDDVLKSIFIHMPKFRVGNLCIRPCVPSPQSTCCQWPFLAGLPVIHVIVAMTNTHPCEDVKEWLKIVSVCVALALENLNRHKLHSTSPVTSSTRHTVQLLRQVQVNQHPFWVALQLTCMRGVAGLLGKPLSNSGSGCHKSHSHSLSDCQARLLECWWSVVSSSRFSASTVTSTSVTVDWLSIDLDPFPLLSSTNSSSLFLFCPEDEIVVLLVLIPRPVKRAALLLDLLC